MSSSKTGSNFISWSEGVFASETGVFALERDASASEKSVFALETLCVYQWRRRACMRWTRACLY